MYMYPEPSYCTFYFSICLRLSSNQWQTFRFLINEINKVFLSCLGLTFDTDGYFVSVTKYDEKQLESSPSIRRQDRKRTISLS